MTETYKGYTIEIEPDEDAESPRECDCFGVMVCFHSRYRLGDTGGRRPEGRTRDGKIIPHRFPQFENPNDFRDWWFGELSKEDEQALVVWEACAGVARIKGTTPPPRPERSEEARGEGKGGILLPLYLYDHSGITISTRPFSCPWDSGQVGWTYCTPQMIRENWMKKRITKALREKAENLLRAEVETYDQYLRGDVYGYRVIDPSGKEVDSCWGFFGEKYCMEEAKSIVNHRVAKATA
jgi:hypothetical protein